MADRFFPVQVRAAPPLYGAARLNHRLRATALCTSMKPPWGVPNAERPHGERSKQGPCRSKEAAEGLAGAIAPAVTEAVIARRPGKSLRRAAGLAAALPARAASPRLGRELPLRQFLAASDRQALPLAGVPPPKCGTSPERPRHGPPGSGRAVSC